MAKELVEGLVEELVKVLVKVLVMVLVMELVEGQAKAEVRVVGMARVGVKVMEKAMAFYLYDFFCSN